MSEGGQEYRGRRLGRGPGLLCISRRLASLPATRPSSPPRKKHVCVPNRETVSACVDSVRPVYTFSSAAVLYFSSTKAAEDPHFFRRRSQPPSPVACSSSSSSTSL